MMAYFSANLMFPKENYHSTNRKQCNAKQKTNKQKKPTTTKKTNQPTKKKHTLAGLWLILPTPCSPHSCEGSAHQHSWFQVYHRGQRSNTLAGGRGGGMHPCPKQWQKYQINAHDTRTRPKCTALPLSKPNLPQEKHPNSISCRLILQKIYTLQNMLAFHHDTEDTKCYTYNPTKALINRHHRLLQKYKGNQIPVFKAQLHGPALWLTPYSEGSRWKILSTSCIVQFWRATGNQT